MRRLHPFLAAARICACLAVWCAAAWFLCCIVCRRGWLGSPRCRQKAPEVKAHPIEPAEDGWYHKVQRNADAAQTDLHTDSEFVACSTCSNCAAYALRGGMYSVYQLCLALSRVLQQGGSTTLAPRRCSCFAHCRTVSGCTNSACSLVHQLLRIVQLETHKRCRTQSLQGAMNVGKRN